MPAPWRSSPGMPRAPVQAGFGCAIDGNAIGAPEPLAPGSGAWTRGELVANAVPLADFTAELARYRRGLLTCAPGVADLPLVGVFPLADTDRALRAGSDATGAGAARAAGLGQAGKRLSCTVEAPTPARALPTIL